MALVLAVDSDEPCVPIAGTTVLVFAEAGWPSQVAYAPANSSTIFWDLGYLFDDLKGIHGSLEFSKVLKEFRETATSLNATAQLHLRGKHVRQERIPKSIVKT